MAERSAALERAGRVISRRTRRRASLPQTRPDAVGSDDPPPSYVFTDYSKHGWNRYYAFENADAQDPEFGFEESS